MLKNLLQSSASLVVLLGALSTLHPAQAMEKEEPIAKKSRSLKSTSKKNKQEKPQLDLSEGYKVIEAHDEVLKVFLMSRGIDYDMLKNTRLVSKKWNGLILQAMEDLKASLLDPIKVEHLINYTNHPSVLIFEHNILGSQYPYQLAYCSSDTEVVRTNDPAPQVPQNVEKFASFIRKSPHLHLSLCEMYTTLDPCKEFEKVALASYVVKNSQNILNGLLKIRKRNI